MRVCERESVVSERECVCVRERECISCTSKTQKHMKQQKYWGGEEGRLSPNSTSCLVVYRTTAHSPS